MLAFLKWSVSEHTGLRHAVHCRPGRPTEGARCPKETLRSTDIADPRGSVHLQLAMAFAQEIFDGAKVLFIHRDVLLKLRSSFWSQLGEHQQTDGGEGQYTWHSS